MATYAITIIEEYGNNCYVLNCAYCEGRGKEPGTWGYSNNPCDICYGKGVVSVQIIGGGPPFVECRNCKGTGRDYDTWGNKTANSCTSCQGVGGQPLAGTMIVL